MYHASEPPNNPFLEDPSTAHARFPDLAIQPGYPSTNVHQNQQLYHQYPPQPYGQPQPQLISPQSQLPSTSYAPQYPAQAQMTGIGALQLTSGFAQQYPTGYPYSGGTYEPQQTRAAPSYLSEFDPYAQTKLQPQASSPSPQPSQGTPYGTGPGGVTHPRDLIRVHKSGLEAWDTYSWKQLLGGCDALKEAWSVRKQQAESVVRQYGAHADPGLFSPDPAFGYNSQVEGWKQVLKDANDNFDTVAASTFQLHEVFNSYRQSGDQASKRRVRESCNAAIKGLPDWPSN